VAASRTKSKHAKPAATATVKPPATKSAEIEPLKAENKAAASAAVLHHKVKTGETLYSIANLYNTTVAALKRDNRNVAVLRPGMILIVPHSR
jgi:LysM repeat protein